MSDRNIALLERSFRDLLERSPPEEPSAVVNPADGYFLYRLLLGRSPDSMTELPEILSGEVTLRQLLTKLIDSHEFAHRSGFLPPNHLFMSQVFGLRFWFNTSDREMGVLMAMGLYEPSTTQLLARLVRPGMTCLDIGAQTGFYTCLIASSVGAEGKVYAFEPMPESYGLLVKNIEENSFDDRVQAFKLAASDQPRSIEATFVSNMYVAGQLGVGTPVQMQAVSVDEYLDDQVDLIKIDIEGHEPAALRGMQRLLQTRPIIVSEANEYWLRTCSGSSGNEYVSQLASLGYDVYDVDDPETKLDPRTFRLEGLQNVNLLAVPAGVSPAALGEEAQPW